MSSILNYWRNELIIIDFSQVSIAAIMVGLGRHQNAELSVDLLRHMILNTIRANFVKFKAVYGDDLVIACDSIHNWRKDIFPLYKASRKKNRDKSDLDWKTIYAALSTIKAELKEFSSYRVLEIDTAEADDIIGVICKKHGAILGDGSGKIMILSGDKDFQQLQTYSNIYQYDPTRKKEIVCNNPEFFLKEHIVRGDQSDGVPNILSDDDTFVTDGKRQKVLSKKRLEEIFAKVDKKDISDFQHGFTRNLKMIDLNQIPDKIQEQIIVQFDSEAGKSRAKLRGYFIEKRLKKLMSQIGDF